MYKGTIKNPEAIPSACNRYTKVVIRLLNEGAFNLPNFKELITEGEKNGQAVV